MFRARNFLRNGLKKVIALGGDGTINEVANGFFEEIIVENNDDISSNNENTENTIPPLSWPFNGRFFESMEEICRT